MMPTPTHFHTFKHMSLINPCQNPLFAFMSLKAARFPRQLLLTVKITCDPLPNVLTSRHFQNGQVPIPDRCTCFAWLFFVSTHQSLPRKSTYWYSLLVQTFSSMPQKVMWNLQNSWQLASAWRVSQAAKRSVRFYMSLGMPFLVKKRRES